MTALGGIEGDRMAATPRFKVYDAQGIYQAACKEAEVAAVVVALLDDGATIRDGHRRIVWTEGKESIPASESCDVVAETVYERAS